MQENNLIVNDWLESIFNTDFDLTCSVSLTELLHHVVLPFILLKEILGLCSLRPRLKVGQIIS